MGDVLSLSVETLLYQSANGEIRLHFDGRDYTGGDVVPHYIFDAQPQHQFANASDYVVQFMTGKYGSNRDNWPPPAQAFCSRVPARRLGTLDES